MRICTRCVLDENYPGIAFDGEGVCTFCANPREEAGKAGERSAKETRFVEILGKVRGRSSYDCVVAYSGGKDSTYTLHLLKRYDLNILAVTFDNGFQSDAAQRNIRNVLERMFVDHLRITPRLDLMREIFTLCGRENLYSAKALERATCICTTCLAMIRFSCFRLALEKGIPVVVLGLSPGQSPLSSAIFKTNPGMIRQMQEAVFRPLHGRVGDGIVPFFLEERHFQGSGEFPYSINPLAFMEYDEDVIYRTIREYGWEPPKDTDPNSTNCLLNAYAVHEHTARYKFHPYAFEIAGLVRKGHLRREEGLERLSRPPDAGIIEMVTKRLAPGE